MTGRRGVVVSGLWKRFRRGARHDTLRDLLAALPRRLAGADRLRDEEFWALRDVSFSVEPGEVLGIIGPNGAGKSTLLRLLAGIIQPTRGTVEVHGRVGALIELAAGFHTELTGRENVFLQGAVHGMSRSEVAARFDAIVAFAEIGPFLDTPLKHYSSGMQARLGFAVAATLEPDMLLVDEVLAVGDWAFQRRAADRLRALVADGVPVVLVSHQLDRVRELCSRAILLREGAPACAGSPDACIAAYVAGDGGQAPADTPVRIEAIDVDVAGVLAPGTEIHARVRGSITAPDQAGKAAVGLRLVALPTEEAVFATDTGAAQVALPASGQFELEFSLRLHVGAGLWRLQGFVLHQDEERLWAAGPSVLLQVGRAPTAVGRVWLDPRIRLLSP